MGEWEGLDDVTKAVIPEGLIDLGDKAMMEVDEELMQGCADTAADIDKVLDRLTALAENIRLNNSETGEAAAMASFLQLTSRLSTVTVGAPLLLARLITRTVWEEN